MPESSRLEFLESFSANNFTWSDAKDNTSRLLNRGGIADLPLFRTLLAICEKSREPSSWEVMDAFVLLAYANLVASRTLLQWLLAFLNFTLESEDLSFWYNKKSDFYELWQWKIRDHGDEWGLNLCFLWGIYTSIPTWTYSQNSLTVAEAPSLKIFSHGTSLRWSWSHSAQE